MARYNKFIVAAGAAVLAGLTAALPIVPVDKKPWLEVAIAVLAAVFVHRVPNQPAEGE